MKKILKICILCACVSPMFAQWVMFADKNDTYIYNNETGEIYIRYKKGGKNYKDVFVKMPHGLQPQELQGSSKTPNNKTPNKTDVSEEMRLESLKKSKDLLDEAIDGAF